jgi:hypothetical protein
MCLFIIRKEGVHPMAMKTQIRGSQVRDESIDSADLASGSIKAGELNSQSITGQTIITSVDTTNDMLLIFDATDERLKQVAPTNLGIGGSGSPAGSDTQIQYNNGSSFGGATALVYDDSNNRVGIGATSPSQVLSVYGNVSGDYVAVIDNDENSSGHGLKVTSDGSGTGTNIFDVESGTTTVFRVRADGKVAIGETSEGGIPTQVEALTVNGDLSFRDYLKRRGDSNTYIGMPANDQMELVAGGVTFVSITENDSQDMIVFNDGAADVDFIVESPNESKALYLHAGNEVFHINHGESNFQTKIHNTNDVAVTIDSSGVVFNEDGHATNDFRIESDNSAHMFFLDSGNDRIGINTSAPDKDLEINNSSGGAIRLTYNDANGSAADYADISVGANGKLTLQTVDSDGEVGHIDLEADGDIVLDIGSGRTAEIKEDGTSLLKITPSSSNVDFQPQVSNKDVTFSSQGGNTLMTIDSSDDAVKIDYKLGYGIASITSTGTLDANAPAVLIMAGMSDVTGTLPDPTFAGQIKIVTGVNAGLGDSIVSYTNAAAGTTTKTIANGTGLLLCSYDATGSGAYRWIPIGDIT